MTNIKVALSIELPGSTLLTNEVCESNPQEYCEGNILITETTVRSGKKPHTKRDVLKYYTRKCIPAKQTVNICEEAYEYMTSKECPEWEKPFIWKKMNRTKKLEANLARVAESLGGKVLSYEVFAD